MPKQNSTIQLRGKFQGRSYYFAKGHQSGFMRAINPNMSERVKTEPNYALTRAYAAEFGHANGWASRALQSLRDVEVYKEPNKLRRALLGLIRGEMKKDTSNPIGARILKGSSLPVQSDFWQNGIVELLNKASKVDVPSSFMDNDLIAVKVNATDRTSLFTALFVCHNEEQVEWIAAGADHLLVRITAVNFYSGASQGSTLEYTEVMGQQRVLGTKYLTLGQDLTIDLSTTLRNVVWPNNHGAELMGLVYIDLCPYRLEGTIRRTLERFRCRRVYLPVWSL